MGNPTEAKVTPSFIPLKPGPPALETMLCRDKSELPTALHNDANRSSLVPLKPRPPALAELLRRYKSCALLWRAERATFR